MKKISISPSAAVISFDKWTKAFLWFVIIGLLGLCSLIVFLFGKKEDKLFLYITPIYFVAIVYAAQRFFSTDEMYAPCMMDEVYDEGDSLLFKKNGKSVRINLNDIKDVDFSLRGARHNLRLIVSLRCKTEFGQELEFVTDVDWITGRNKDIIDLIDRVERAKGQH
jgi:hypothetical protein